jgi:hypothetical protein
MTAAAITTLRSTLATDLANPGVWSTFAYPAPTLLANSVSVIPSDPYITPSNNDYATISPLANFKILIATPAFDNQGNLAGIEDFIVAVFNKIASSSLSLNVTSTSAPSIINAASGDLLTAEMTVSILTTWS